MALIYADSFDHYATADRAAKGWDGSGSGQIEAGGRFGTNRLRVDTSGTGNQRRDLPASYTTLIAGFAYSPVVIGVTPYTILDLLDTGTQHVTLVIDTAGRLVATRAGTTLGTGTIIMSSGFYYYIEVKVTISDAAGVVVTRINEVVDLNLSSQDTRNGASASVNQFRFWQGDGSHVGIYDDLYICDTSGGSPTNDFLGDVRVEALFPNGNGNSSQFVGSDSNSTDNYLLVDESTPNGDTDYVESLTVGNKDTYAFGNMTPTTGAVYGVQTLPYARKTDAGTRSIASVARLAGTEVDSTSHALPSSYQYQRDIYETKPGGGAWSVSDVNSAEFGPKVTA